jgi:polyferredoxin
MAASLPSFFLRLRFATATISTWLMNLGMFGDRFKARSICSPGFNCHGCPWATAACPIGAIAYGSAIHAIPVYAIASVLAVGAVAGRLVCGFACPMGLFQDLLHRIPSPKFRLPRFFRYGKYLALALLVLLLPWILGFRQGGYLMLSKPAVDKNDLGLIVVKVLATNLGTEPVKGPHIIAVYRSIADQTELYRVEKDFPEVTIEPGQKDVPLPWIYTPNYLSVANMEVSSPQSEVIQNSPYLLYYCRLCPTGTLTATLPSWFSPTPGVSMYDRARGAWLRLSILGLFLVWMVVSSRPLCRTFCPLGAIYAMAAPLSLASMRIEQSQCTGCGTCDSVCPMELDVRKEIGGMECIACGDCKKACPGDGIKRTFGFGLGTCQTVALTDS